MMNPLLAFVLRGLRAARGLSALHSLSQAQEQEIIWPRLFTTPSVKYTCDKGSCF